MAFAKPTKNDHHLTDVQTALHLLGVTIDPQQVAGLLTMQSGTRRIVSAGTTDGFTKALKAVVQGGGGTTILEFTE